MPDDGATDDRPWQCEGFRSVGPWRLIRVLRGWGMRHAGAVRACAVAHDGTHVATACGNTAHLWDAATGAELRTFRGHTGRIRVVQVLSDLTRLLTYGRDDTVRYWDLASGELLDVVNLERSRHQSYWSFSPCGLRVVTSNQERVWVDYLGTKRRGRTLRSYWSCSGSNLLAGAAFALNGQRVRTWALLYSGIGPVSEAVEEFDIASGRPVRSLRYENVRTWRHCTPSTTDSDESVAARLWWYGRHDMPRPLRERPDAQRKGGPVLAFHRSRDGAALLTGARDGSARLWDLGAERIVHGPEPRVARIGFSPGGRMVYAQLDDDAGTWLAWSASDGGDRPSPAAAPGVAPAVPPPSFRPRMGGAGDRVLATALSPDGRTAGVVTRRSAVLLYERDPASGRR